MIGSWQVSPCSPVRDFLPAAAAILRGNITLCVEHAFTCEAGREFYSRYKIPHQFKALRDTSSPRTELFHCRFTSNFVAELISLLENEDIDDFLWHFRAYDNQRQIFYSHDAYYEEHSVLMSSRYSESLAGSISGRIGCELSTSTHTPDWESIQRES